ncbi:MAG TPA: sigma-70 family RNA polymerase sigma factor [Acetobacteraceae bacterium]|jgi:RNA polymerase sigma-70 factor, ECF subfamily|nr:sigma-70 family RNA polymerase sigma factor [Acetobacteraceae bacterium]
MPRRREDAAGGGAAAVNPLAGLLGRIAAGDQAAFRKLYELVSPLLYAVALRITGERALAADALQEAFIQVLNRSSRFDPARGSAEAWLVSLVRYRALDIVRGRRREVLGFEPEDAALDEPDALARLSADEDGAALRTCLEALEADRRRLIELAFLDGFSQAELAQRLGMPLGTVKSSIRRGLLKLRECLGR